MEFFQKFLKQNSNRLVAVQRNINLSEIEWKKSVSGKYFYVTDIKNAKAIAIGSWEGKDVDPSCVFPFISSKGNAAIFADKMLFDEASTITVLALTK